MSENNQPHSQRIPSASIQSPQQQWERRKEQQQQQQQSKSPFICPGLYIVCSRKDSSRISS